MARNREPVKAVDSQSEEEDDEGSSEEVDSQESDSEPEHTQNKSKSPLAVKPQQPPPPSSSEEEDSGSETESDSDGPDPKIRPTEKPQKSIDAPRMARSKPNDPPSKFAAAKRPSEDAAAHDAKKSKKTIEPETSEKKPNLFQRLWSEEDEIVILKGMIHYSAKNRSDPVSDLNSFHDFIKKSLHIDFTRTQLQDKIRRLKKKYENNKSKEKEGKERSFAKLHEQSVYDLSKEIWGNESGKDHAVGSPKSNGGVGKKTQIKKGNGNAVKNGVVVSGGAMEERMLLNGREIYEVGQGIEGEKEWEKLKLEDLQLYLKQLELRIAQTKLVLNAIKGGDD